MKPPHIAQDLHVRALAMATGAALCLGLTTGSAQLVAPQTYVMPAYSSSWGRDLGFYFSSSAGPSFMPKFQTSRFGYEGNFSMQTGGRFDAEPGFNFLSTDVLTLGGEFETGVIYNRICSVNQADSPASFSGDYYQVPLLVNLVLKFHPGSFVVPYIGVGGGGN
jgi:opacity protein-like surface antigen